MTQFRNITVGGDLLSRVTFRCPHCFATDLAHSAEIVSCVCGAEYPVKGNQYFFTQDQTELTNDELDRLKFGIKRYSNVYRFLINVLSPVYPATWFRIRPILRMINRSGAPAINIGSGSTSLSEHVVNLDFIAYPNVDIVGSVYEIPIASDSINVAFNIAVLEHLNDPIKAVEEMHRILVPGGKLYVFVPFVQGFHASPHDYQRYTKSGLIHLFRNFTINRIVNDGPTSGMLWILQEWLATLLCFGSQRLQRLLCIAFMCLTFPVKLLDVLLIHFPSADNIATGFFLELTKPEALILDSETSPDLV